MIKAVRLSVLSFLIILTSCSHTYRYKPPIAGQNKALKVQLETMGINGKQVVMNLIYTNLTDSKIFIDYSGIDLQLDGVYTHLHYKGAKVVTTNTTNHKKSTATEIEKLLPLFPGSSTRSKLIFSAFGAKNSTKGALVISKVRLGKEILKDIEVELELTKSKNYIKIINGN